MYEFEANSYQLDINRKEENNALHGLVYNKTFEVIDKKITDTFASVKLVYHEKNRSSGFPFTYSIYVEYVLIDSGLYLNLEVKNTDSKIFPFTLGWHPYFLSSDLYNSSVIFDSKLKLKLDNRSITKKMVHNDYAEGFKISNQSLDDCFVLDSNEVLFITPDYILELKSTEKESYLQLFTPPHKNAMAIEPTTGVSNSFNNRIGLKTLKPKEVYKISWNIEITKPK
jgi:aldose 1-epimerase